MGSKAQANDDKYVLKGLAAGLIGGLVASITHVDRFRGIHEEYMRAKAIDYFENSRRAIFGQQSYAQRNPRKLIGYGRYSWGSRLAMVRVRQ
ncbi:MAG TPA: glucoamylase family protein [Pyrinomonadaceae bacterium]|nr:glucoamylase family protein [Pyrinomonadaceae bacterium]